MNSIGLVEPIRLVMVDDHPLLREGLLTWFDRTPEIEIVGVAGDGETGLELVAEYRPQILLLDLRLPDISGVEVAHRTYSQSPSTAIVVLTGYNASSYVSTLRQAGVRAIVEKSAAPAHVVKVIRTVATGMNLLPAANIYNYAGSTWLVELTTREYQVLRLVARGQRNTSIANELGISIKTVEVHVSSILTKLGAQSRTEAVDVAYRLGILLLENLARDSSLKNVRDHR